MPDARWGHVELDVEAGRQSPPPVPEDETPFHILVLGDFSGRGTRPAAPPAVPLASRRPRRVDRDDVDDVLSALEPEVLLPTGSGDGITIRIRALDDFHPDRLYTTLPLFQSLRDLRTRLADPKTFAGAARELLGDDPAQSPAHPDRGAAPAAPGHLLDAILGGPLDAPAAGPPAADELQELIRRSVAPHLVAADDPRLGPLLARVDASIAVAMRQLLHHPLFQALEAVWRGVEMLTRQLDTSTMLQLHLLDVSIPDLVADAAAQTKSGAPSAVGRAIAGGPADALGGAPWALIVGAYTFGWDDADLVVLDHLAAVARHAGAPFVAGAAPRLVGAPSFDGLSDAGDWSRQPLPAWAALRRSPNARWIGLVAPRLLARAPYGESGETCERLEFEELLPDSRHSDLLWANGAFACARLLGQSFSDAGWRMRPGMIRELDQLPYVNVQRDGQARLQPCAELLLTERAAAWMMECGVMPLASLKDRDAALLVRFQSVAHPVRALAGRWSAAERDE